jgi:hypothetical protein
MRGLDCQTPSRPRVDPIGTALSAWEYERNQFTVFLNAYFEVGRCRLATVDPPPHIGTIKNISHERTQYDLSKQRSCWGDCSRPALSSHASQGGNSAELIIAFNDPLTSELNATLSGSDWGEEANGHIQSNCPDQLCPDPSRQYQEDGLDNIIGGRDHHWPLT